MKIKIKIKSNNDQFINTKEKNNKEREKKQKIHESLFHCERKKNMVENKHGEIIFFVSSIGVECERCLCLMTLTDQMEPMPSITLIILMKHLNLSW